MDSGRLQAAIWGGAFIGVLSGLPFVKMGNACCCLWVIAGGVLAVWLAQKNDPRPLTAADGLLLGIVAGAVGAVITLPLDLMFGPMERGLLLRWIEQAGGDVSPEMIEMFERGARGGAALVLGFFFALCINVIFAMLGGLLGVAMFKKNPPPPPPGPQVPDVVGP